MGKKVRWYRDGDNLVAGEEHRLVASFPDALRIEGYVALRNRGISHDDIISGKAIPQRTQPVGAKRVTDDTRWREAIAHTVAVDETGKQGLVAMTSEAKEAALRIGRDYAFSLERPDVRDFRKRTSVQIWYAKLFGNKEPVRRPRPVAAEAQLAQAAD